MKLTVYTTDNGSLRLAKTAEINHTDYYDVLPVADSNGFHPGDVEADTIRLYPEVKRQQIHGFGGAFTESAAYVFATAPEETKAAILDGYFGKNGIGYNYGRVSIGGCDFSLSAYSYIPDGATDLGSFSVARDEQYTLPFVKAALAENPGITLFASPWSPPPHLKTNEKWQGGKLMREYYSLWARYVAAFVLSYAERGVRISAVTVQNELRHAQVWESCLYEKEEELDFAVNYLARELKPLGVKIYVYDHCRERVFSRASYAFGASSDVDGIACHWYSGDYFDELRMTRERFPDKDIIVSEACVPMRKDKPASDYDGVVLDKYAHDIIGDLNGGANAFCDWNLVLDERRGPSHFRNNRPMMADAPIIVGDDGKAIFRPSFYAIGHFSKFIARGARIIGCSQPYRDVEVTAALNPDGSVATVVYNRGAAKRVKVLMGTALFELDLGENTLSTLVIEK